MKFHRDSPGSLVRGGRCGAVGRPSGSSFVGIKTYFHRVGKKWKIKHNLRTRTRTRTRTVTMWCLCFQHYLLIFLGQRRIFGPLLSGPSFSRSPTPPAPVLVNFVFFFFLEGERERKNLPATQGVQAHPGIESESFEISIKQTFAWPRKRMATDRSAGPPEGEEQRERTRQQRAAKKGTQIKEAGTLVHWHEQNHCSVEYN